MQYTYIKVPLLRKIKEITANGKKIAARFAAYVL
jgi:hypothetical protein